MTSTQQEKEFDNHIPEFLNMFSNLRKEEIVKLKINGEFVRIYSKGEWKTISQCKAALTNYVKSQSWSTDYTSRLIYKIGMIDAHRDPNQVWREFVKYLEYKGIIEYVTIKE